MLQADFLKKIVIASSEYRAEGDLLPFFGATPFSALYGRSSILYVILA